MARQRIVLEEDASVTGAATQDYKSIVKVGPWKTGYAVFIMHTGGASMTGIIETSPIVHAGGSTASALWTTVGSGALATTSPGVTIVNLSTLPLMDVLRWRTTGSAAIRFTVILYLYDT